MEAGFQDLFLVRQISEFACLKRESMHYGGRRALHVRRALRAEISRGSNPAFSVIRLAQVPDGLLGGVYVVKAF